MMEWEVEERLPPYDTEREFDVWMRNGSVRTVRRIGNVQSSFAPGTLIFTDAAHPLSNAICDEDLISGWRYSGRMAEVLPRLEWPPRDFTRLALQNWSPNETTSPSRTPLSP